MVLISFITLTAFTILKEKRTRINAPGPLPIAVLKVGDTYKGGYVAYLLKSGDAGYDANTQHGLLAAPADIIVGTQMQFVWDNPGTAATGATGNTLFSGVENTTKIIAATSNRATAAKYCSSYTLTGNTGQWYLPCGDELYKLYTGIGSRVGVANAPDPNKYGFYPNPYWSSFEQSATQAQSFNFYTGTAYNGTPKNGTKRIRAVQRF